MIATVLAFEFDFGFDFVDKLRKPRMYSFLKKDIVNSNLTHAFCARYGMNSWACIDKYNNELTGFRIECPDTYLYPHCQLIFAEPPKSYFQYSNFGFNEVNTGSNPITPPDDYIPSGGSVYLGSIDTLLFKSNEMTASRKGQHFKYLINAAGSYLIIDELMCKNTGFDGRKVIWSCYSPDISKKYVIRNVDVNCEGYSGPNDVYVVPGSCYAVYDIARK